MTGGRYSDPIRQVTLSSSEVGFREKCEELNILTLSEPYYGSMALACFALDAVNAYIRVLL